MMKESEAEELVERSQREIQTDAASTSPKMEVQKKRAAEEIRLAVPGVARGLPNEEEDMGRRMKNSLYARRRRRRESDTLKALQDKCKELSMCNLKIEDENRELQAKLDSAKAKVSQLEAQQLTVANIVVPSSETCTIPPLDGSRLQRGPDIQAAIATMPGENLLTQPTSMGSNRQQQGLDTHAAMKALIQQELLDNVRGQTQTRLNQELVARTELFSVLGGGISASSSSVYPMTGGAAHTTVPSNTLQQSAVQYGLLGPVFSSSLLEQQQQQQQQQHQQQQRALQDRILAGGQQNDETEAMLRLILSIQQGNKAS